MTYLLLLLLLPLSAFSYNHNRCKRTFTTKSRAVMGGALHSSLTDASTSTSQFVTSTGNCAAIGMNKEEQRKNFYIANFDKIKIDIAKGHGGYLTAMISLGECQPGESSHLNKSLQESFSAFYQLKDELSYSIIAPMIDRHCHL